LRNSLNRTVGHFADLDVLDGLPFGLIMLAKTQARHDLARAAAPRRDRPMRNLEKGILAARDIATAPDCAALLRGAEDLIADLGGFSSRDDRGRYRAVAAHSRSQVLVSASADGMPALDSVYLDIADLNGLRRESEEAVQSGFTAKVCVHPTQVSFRPRSSSPTDRPGHVSSAAIAAGDSGEVLAASQMRG